jgi:hypothetical protein
MLKNRLYSEENMRAGRKVMSNVNKMGSILRLRRRFYKNRLRRLEKAIVNLDYFLTQCKTYYN